MGRARCGILDYNNNPIQHVRSVNCYNSKCVLEYSKKYLPSKARGTNGSFSLQCVEKPAEHSIRNMVLIAGS